MSASIPKSEIISFSLESLFKAPKTSNEIPRPNQVGSPKAIDPKSMAEEVQITALRSVLGETHLLNSAVNEPLGLLRKINEGINSLDKEMNSQKQGNIKPKVIKLLQDIQTNYQSFNNYFSQSLNDKHNASPEIKEYWITENPRKFSFDDIVDDSVLKAEIKKIHETKIKEVVDALLGDEHIENKQRLYSHAFDRAFETLTDEYSNFLAKEQLSSDEQEILINRDEIHKALMDEYLNLGEDKITLKERFHDLVHQEYSSLKLEEQYFSLAKNAKILSAKADVLKTFNDENSLNLSDNFGIKLQILKNSLKKANNLDEKTKKSLVNFIEKFDFGHFGETLAETIDSQIQNTRYGRLSARLMDEYKSRPGIEFLKELTWMDNYDIRDLPTLDYYVDLSNHDQLNEFSGLDLSLSVLEAKLANQKLSHIHDDLIVTSDIDSLQSITLLSDVERVSSIGIDENLSEGFINESRTSLALRLLQERGVEGIEISKVINGSYSGPFDLCKFDLLIIGKIDKDSSYFALPIQVKTARIGSFKQNKYPQIGLIMTKDKSIDDLIANFETVLSNHLHEPSTHIPLSSSQFKKLSLYSSNLSTFQELDILTLLNDPILLDTLSDFQSDRLDLALEKISEKSLDLQNDLKYFIVKEGISNKLSKISEDDLISKFSSNSLAKELPKAFLRLAVHKFAKHFPESMSHTEFNSLEINNYVKQSLIESKQEWLRIQDEYKQYSSAVSEALNQAYLKEFKEQFNQYIDNEYSDDKEKRNLIKSMSFIATMKNLISESSISFSDFKDSLPTLLSRTLSKLRVKKMKPDNLAFRMMENLTREARGLLKHKFLNSKIKDSLNTENWIQGDENKAFLLFKIPSSQIQEAIDFLSEDLNIHKIVKASNPKRKDFIESLQNNLIETLYPKFKEQIISKMSSRLKELNAFLLK